MHKALGFLTGLGLGAGVMYAFDPDRGQRRRALARDKMIHLVRTSERAVDKASRDLTHRAWGLVAEARSALGDHSASDIILVDRVRSAVGRAVSHPHAVEVSAQEGRITLRGPVLVDEVDRLIHAVGGVRGVDGVENHLHVHETADNVPGLQGGRKREPRFELMQQNWSPAARVLVGTGGSLLVWVGARRRGFWGSLLAVLGAGMIARAATNAEIAALLGLETENDAERRTAGARE